MVALLAALVIVVAGKVQRLHPTPDEISDLRPFDLLRVVVTCLVDHIYRVLNDAAEKKRKALFLSTLHCDTYSELNKKAQRMHRFVDGRKT